MPPAINKPVPRKKVQIPGTGTFWKNIIIDMIQIIAKKNEMMTLLPSGIFFQKNTKMVPIMAIIQMTRRIMVLAGTLPNRVMQVDGRGIAENSLPYNLEDGLKYWQVADFK